MKKILFFSFMIFSHSLFSEPVLPLTPMPSSSLITGVEIFKLFASLVSVILLVLIFSYLFRKVNGLSFRSNGSMEIISTLSVGTKEKIILLEVSGESLLIGVTQGGISLLKTVESKVADEYKKDDSFSEKFKHVLKKVT